jgi:hypothetical protein
MRGISGERSDVWMHDDTNYRIHGDDDEGMRGIMT